MSTWSMSRVRLVLVTLFAVGVLVANATPVEQLVTFARGNSTASHILLVPAITLALLFHYRREIVAEVSTGWALGSLLLMMALAAAVLGRTDRAGDSALSIQIAAMVLALIGGFVLGFGVRAFRVALFPLLFLAFAIPIPPPALAAITLFLKRGSADAVSALFSATGTPFHRDGFVFALPGTVIEVADECSGIRSSIALVLTMLLTGHLYLQRGWTRLALLLAVLPVAVIKNGVRIVTLSLLALHVDPSFLTGQLHHDGGFVFFIIGLVMLAPVLALLRRADVMPAASSPL